MQKILGYAILAAGIAYCVLILYRALSNKDKFLACRGRLALLLPAEAILFFIAASGISDYVMNTIVANRLHTADDKELPGTLVVSSLVPGSIIAFSLLRSESVVHWSVIAACGITAMLGSFVGVRLVRRFEGGVIRKIMAVALMFSLAALIFRMIVSKGAMSDATFLPLPKLILGAVIIFFTGVLNMFGIPMKATWTAIFLLLGLSPLSTLTMSLVLGSISVLSGGVGIIRQGNYHQKTAVAAATAGAFGALLGVLFTLSLSPLALNIILIIVMLIAIVTMLRK